MARHARSIRGWSINARCRCWFGWRIDARHAMHVTERCEEVRGDAEQSLCEERALHREITIPRITQARGPFALPQRPKPLSVQTISSFPSCGGAPRGGARG